MIKKDQIYIKWIKAFICSESGPKIVPIVQCTISDPPSNIQNGRLPRSRERRGLRWRHGGRDHLQAEGQQKVTFIASLWSQRYFGSFNTARRPVWVTALYLFYPFQNFTKFQTNCGFWFTTLIIKKI